ncbi:MAG: replication initiation protein [Bacteroidota bacterium]
MAIIKHNKLIETSYKLNSREQFFVLYLISQISQMDKRFREYKMHYSEIEKIINFDGKRRIANKAEVFTLMDKLNSEPIIYERGTVIGKSVWLQHMEHDTETDIFTFSLSEKLREYLVQLKEHFTKYNISNIVYLNSNAVRLYEVLKRYQFKGECELGIEKIKFYLGIEHRYPKFYEFKRWVLIPSQREIEKYTDIRFEFVPGKKQKKRILSLKFYIYENEPQHSTDTRQSLNRIDGKGERSAKRGEKSEVFNNGQADLSVSLQRSYVFLSSKGINKKFILEQILTHPKVSYAPLSGYEDLYFRYLWKFFSDKTNVDEDKKAGAFVSWWKNGRLTEDGLHARIVESVIQRKKAERDQTTIDHNRKRSPKGRGKQDLNFLFQPKQFNIDTFKKTYPDRYQTILQRVRSEYEKTFESLDTPFDPEKYRKSIEDKVYHDCKEWAETVEM